MGKSSRIVELVLQGRRWWGAALAVAVTCGLFAATTPPAMASTAVTATLAEATNNEGSGGTVRVLTVTNGSSATVTKISTNGGASEVLPTSSCTSGEVFTCTLTVAPGASTTICIVNGSPFTAESVEVTFAGGSYERIEPKHAPTVPKCPIGSVKSTPGKTAKCVVPQLKGKKLATAETALKRAHCSVGKIKKASSKRVKKGSVVSQSPAAGRSLPGGTAVSLTVSKGG